MTNNKSLISTLTLGLTAFAIALAPATRVLADEQPAGTTPAVSAEKQELKETKKELHEKKMQIKKDKQKLHQDAKEQGKDSAAVQGDKAQLKQDRAEKKALVEKKRAEKRAIRKAKKGAPVQSTAPQGQPASDAAPAQPQQ
jgi:hypothetical protein